MAQNSRDAVFYFGPNIKSRPGKEFLSPRLSTPLPVAIGDDRVAVDQERVPRRCRNCRHRQRETVAVKARVAKGRGEDSQGQNKGVENRRRPR
jgi:hypothetical protein